MSGGHSNVPIGSLAWPTSEAGGMGIDAAVELSYRREIEKVGGNDGKPIAAGGSKEPNKTKIEQQDLVDQFKSTMVKKLYGRAKALSGARLFGGDALIDPAETRRWIHELLGGDGRSKL